MQSKEKIDKTTELEKDNVKVDDKKEEHSEKEKKGSERFF